MGFLKLFTKTADPPPRLPHGTFTVDAAGRILVATVPSSVPSGIVEAISRCVLQTFLEAKAVQLPLFELTVHFGGLKIVARELRGGALVFLTPLEVITPPPPAPMVDI